MGLGLGARGTVDRIDQAVLVVHMRVRGRVRARDRDCARIGARDLRAARWIASTRWSL